MNPVSENKRLELIFFSLIFIVLSVLTFWVFKPFLYIIVLGAVLSVLFHPLYKKLENIFKGADSLIAFILVVLAFIFLIIPILLFGFKVFGQAQNFLSLTQISQGQYVQSIQQNINSTLQDIVPGLVLNISDPINRVRMFIYNNFGGLLSQTTYIFFQTFLMLFTFFFFLRDGDKILSSFVSLSPFKKEQNKEILDSVYRTINSVVRGILFVGLIRLVLIILAFYSLGIPDVVLWGSIGGIVGAIPGLGTPFVIIPAFIYLLLYSNPLFAILMVIFGILLSIFIDNMLSAYFFNKGFGIPPVFILFSILGGIFFFGPLGFIFGPIILSLFISMVDMYKILILNRS